MKPPQKLPSGRPFPAQQSNQPSNRQPFKPGIVQPKSGSFSSQPNHPATPPAYRPQVTPKVLQTKTSLIQPSPNPPLKSKPVAPPVYRPQSLPRVLQAKTPATRQAVKQSGQAPVAPPAYRPQPAPKVLQTKSAQNQPAPLTKSTRQPVMATPHRPEPRKIVQPKMAAKTHARRLPKAAPAQVHPNSKAVVQRRLKINNGKHAGTYTQVNLTQLLDSVAKVIEINHSDEKVKRGPLPLVRAKGLYEFDTMDDLASYMVDTNADGPTMEFDKQYGADHGDYHFTGKVTKKKAQWTISKNAAKLLMEAEIDKYLQVLIDGSKDEGWTPWYIGGNAKEPIGETVVGKETSFTIQLQVNKEDNLISYHGYPDQRLKKCGVGTSKKSLE